MKTKKEILKGRFVIESNGKQIVFDDKTPKKAAMKIVEIYSNKTRVVFDYGDIQTNRSWGETYDITGRIGLCRGYYNLHYPILLHNSTSLGGGTILTDCILSIRESRGKKLIYKNQ